MNKHIDKQWADAMDTKGVISLKCAWQKAAMLSKWLSYIMEIASHTFEFEMAAYSPMTARALPYAT